jgi:uncharacterized protein YggT (Ycf19 family)
MGILCLIIQVYLVVCFARVIFSWIPVDGNNILSAVSTAVYHATEPLFATVRNVLPRPGDLPIDLSPAVVIIVLGLLRTVVCNIH